MKRDVRLFLILGCILILLLEAPAALSSVAADLGEPYAQWEAPPKTSLEASTPGEPAAVRESTAVSRRD